MTPAIRPRVIQAASSVRAVEAGLALLARRGVLQPDDGEDDQGDQDHDGEEVLDEADPVPLADTGEVEGHLEEVPVGLHDGQQQDGEAPHGEEVGQARNGPLQQLALAGHLCDLGFCLGDDAPPGPLRGGLARPDELGQPVEPPPGNAESDHGDASPTMILTSTDAPRILRLSNRLATGFASAAWDSDAWERIVCVAYAGVVQRQNISFPS